MMSYLLDVAYLLALGAACPFILLRSWKTGRYRQDLGQRLGRFPQGALIPQPGANRRRCVLHCVSVGEILSVRRLVEELLAADPQLDIILTTTTDTGMARAREIYAGPAYNQRVRFCRYPLDLSWAVNGFLEAAQPHLLGLMELETWPNFLRQAHRMKIPVLLLNGRLTERSHRRYRLIRPLIADMFSRIHWFGIQTRTIADRFIDLGAPPQRLEILPTLKYDNADLSKVISGSPALAQACGLAAGEALWVAGSTGPGEEIPLLETLLALRPTAPTLRLAIAPRKPETLPLLLEALARHGLQARLRSKHPDGSPPPAPLSAQEVLVLDTLGELRKLYSLAGYVFVGRSLVPLGGSDMIEVAALAKPCCFGPYTENFREAVDLLLAGEGAVKIENASQLRATLERWLSNTVDSQNLGQRARQIVESQCGSTDRYVKKMLEVLNTHESMGRSVGVAASGEPKPAGS